MEFSNIQKGILKLITEYEKQSNQCNILRYIIFFLVSSMLIYLFYENNQLRKIIYTMKTMETTKTMKTTKTIENFNQQKNNKSDNYVCSIKNGNIKCKKKDK